jgi:hypothetical protein
MVRYGAAAAVLASFLALAWFWPTARLEGATSEQASPGPGGAGPRALGVLLRIVGLAAFALVFAAAAVGDSSGTTNLAPLAVFNIFWVGLLFVSGFVGDVWRVLSPFDTIAAAASRLRPRRHPEADGTIETEEEAGEEDDRAPAGWGYWPGAAGLLIFAWVELVYPDATEPRRLCLLMAAYTVVMLAGAGRWGRGWLRRGEPFAALFGVLGHMAPLWRDESGRLRLRPPFVGLARLSPRPGLEALVMVALGSTTFDGVTRTQYWMDTTTDLTGLSKVLASTAGLLWCVGMVAIAYLGSMRIAAGLVGYERTPEELRADFVHSLVPIALAYAVAHYFSYLVLNGQGIIALLSDPFGRGWDLFGTATHKVDYNLVSPRSIALVQSGAIVLGHVAGVVLAHDRALALFERRLATRSQYPLLAVMVLFTVGGLFLLQGG